MAGDTEPTESKSTLQFKDLIQFLINNITLNIICNRNNIAELQNNKTMQVDVEGTAEERIAMLKSLTERKTKVIENLRIIIKEQQAYILQLQEKLERALNEDGLFDTEIDNASKYARTN